MVGLLACLVSHGLTSTGLAQAARPGDASAREAPAGVTNVTQDGDRFSVVVENDDVVVALRELSILTRKSIVPSADVHVVVNVSLFGVTLDQALAALTAAAGLGVDVENGIYRVLSAAEVEFRSQRPIAIQSRLFPLDYLRPADAIDLIRGTLSPAGSAAAIQDRLSDNAGIAQALGSLGDTGSSTEAVHRPRNDEFATISAVVVHDYPEYLNQVARLLAAVDTKPRQVLIEVTAIQTGFTEKDRLGVDFKLTLGGAFGDFIDFGAGGVSKGATLGSNDGVITSSSGSSASGGLDPNITIGGILGDDLGIFITALEMVTDVTVLSKPKILTLNRQHARVHVGRKVGYLLTSTTENQVNESIEFIDDGIVLDVRPFILEDGRIRLKVSPKVSRVSFRTEGGRSIPEEDLSIVETDIVVPPGYVVFIGGLYREDTTKVESKLPWLGDIPYLGALFSGHSDVVEKKEVIFMLRPSVLSEAELGDMGNRGEEVEERVRVGSRLGLLPWSRERRSACLNLRAEAHLQQGEDAEALHCLERSLELHPHQADALRLRERVLADRRWWYTRSYLESMIVEEIEMAGGTPKGGAR